VLFVLAAIVLIIGFLVNLFQSLFFLFFPLSIIALILFIVSLMLSVGIQEYPSEVTKGLFIVLIVCTVITYLSYLIGFGFGGTDFGTMAKKSFDITMSLFFNRDINALVNLK